MVNIRDYIKISHNANLITGNFTNPEDFSKNYSDIHESERQSFLRFYIVNNTPYVFKEMPLLFEQLTQYLADKLRIHPIEVKLIGSAKTGFSISPPPGYGKPFGAHSDLDFSIINEDLFNTIHSEYNSWSDKYRLKVLIPRNENEVRYWNANLGTGCNQLKRGFLDTNKIPNLCDFEYTQKINNSLSLITVNLAQIHSITVKKASASVYKNWSSFGSRLKYNTESILKKAK